jgi:hypothetical protein
MSSAPLTFGFDHVATLTSDLDRCVPAESIVGERTRIGARGAP